LIAAVLAAALLAAPGAAAAATPSSAFAGRYPMDVTARLHGEPLGDREVSEAADAVITAVPGRAEVRVRLTSGRYACELSARVEAGALVLAPGQACALELAETGAHGRVDARLRSGRGRLEGDALVLEAAWELSGAVALGPGGGKVDVLGTSVELPVAPKVPVTGTAAATARGSRMRR
jgi:hypothetical protein